MSLNATNNLFLFEFSRDFVSQEIEDRYKIHLDMFRKPYASILDYISSTVKSITMPAITLPTVVQKQAYGKDWTFRGSQAPNDVFTRELTITFKLVDSHMTYHILQDVLMFLYMRKEPFLKQIMLTTLDLNQRELYKFFYKSVVFKGISDTTFSNSDTQIEERDVTVSFVYNEIEIEYMPRYGDQGPAGQLIDEYSQRINQAIANDN